MCIFRESWLSITISGRRPQQLPAIDLTDVTGGPRTNVTPGPPDHHPAGVSTPSPLVHCRRYGTGSRATHYYESSPLYGRSPFSINNRKWIPIPTLSSVTACTWGLNIIILAGSVRYCGQYNQTSLYWTWWDQANNGIILWFKMFRVKYIRICG